MSRSAHARSRQCSASTVRFGDIASITNLDEISCLHRHNLLDSHRDIKIIHSQDIWDRVRMVGIEAVDSEADVDVLELIRLWLPILVGCLPFTIVKVVNKVRCSHEIGAFDGEIFLIKQHIDNLVNLGKIRAKILVVLHLYDGISSIGIVVEISFDLEISRDRTACLVEFLIKCRL